jgi:hypothetical protein
MGSSMLDEDQVPIEVQMEDSMLRVRFRGGLELATFVARFPHLKSAGPAQQNADPAQRIPWKRFGRDHRFHWHDADEDISIRGLFATQSPSQPPVVRSFESIHRWFKSTLELAEVA